MPWPGWVGNAAGARRVWMCDSAGADYIGDWYRKWEKKKSPVGEMRRKSVVSTGIGFLHSCWNKEQSEQSVLFQQLPTVLGCLLCWDASLAGVPGCLPCWGTTHSSHNAWGSLWTWELRATPSHIALLPTPPCQDSALLCDLLNVRAKERGGDSVSLQLLKALPSTHLVGLFRTMGVGW